MSHWMFCIEFRRLKAHRRCIQLPIICDHENTVRPVFFNANQSFVTFQSKFYDIVCVSVIVRWRGFFVPDISVTLCTYVHKKQVGGRLQISAATSVE
jgi:hypothetical protein